MLKRVIAAWSVAAILMANGAAFADTAPAADDTQAAATTSSKSDNWRQEREARMMTRMKASLDLTDDQAQKLQSILGAWREQTKQHRSDFKGKLRNVLTSEQQAKLDQARQRREAWKKERAEKREGKGKDEGSKKDAHERKRDGKARSAGHRPIDHHPLALDLTADQQKQIRSLMNQCRHIERADREQMLAQTSALLTPLQEQQFERDIKHAQHHSWRHGHDHRHRGGDRDHKGPGKHGDAQEEHEDKDAMMPEPVD